MRLFQHYCKGAYYNEFDSSSLLSDVQASICCRRASLSENRRRCVSEAAEVIWRKQNRVKEWP